MKWPLFLAVVILLSACSVENPTQKVVRDSVNGTDLLIEHTSGPALSQAGDRVFVTRDGKRDLIFEGFGAPSINLKPLREGVLLIEYCGGSVRKVDSFLAGQTSSGNAIAVKVQPIVIENVDIDGSRLCAK